MSRYGFVPVSLVYNPCMQSGWKALDLCRGWPFVLSTADVAVFVLLKDASEFCYWLSLHKGFFFFFKIKIIAV